MSFYLKLINNETKQFGSTVAATSLVRRWSRCVVEAAFLFVSRYSIRGRTWTLPRGTGAGEGLAVWVCWMEYPEFVRALPRQTSGTPGCPHTSSHSAPRTQRNV